MRNLALVGAGNWGKNLARNFHALGVLHTICDPKEAILDGYQTQFPEVKLTTNFKAVLENPDIARNRHCGSCRSALYACQANSLGGQRCLC